MPKVAEHVFDTPVDDGVAIMDLNKRLYFSLNETGTVIWQGLKNGDSVDEIAQALVAQYDVETDRAMVEVQRLIDELRQKNLLIEE